MWASLNNDGNINAAMGDEKISKLNVAYHLIFFVRDVIAPFSIFLQWQGRALAFIFEVFNAEREREKEEGREKSK